MSKINRFPKRIASALRGVTFAIIWDLRTINIDFFFKIGRFIFPPLNAAINIFLIIFTLYELYKNPSKSNLINAIFETITGACIVAGLIGSLILGGPFEILIAPILLITCFSLRAFKSLYDLKNHNNTFDEKLPNILNFASGIIGVCLIVLICFTGMPSFGILGVLAGILSAIAAILLVIEHKKASYHDQHVNTTHLHPASTIDAQDYTHNPWCLLLQTQLNSLHAAKDEKILEVQQGNSKPLIQRSVNPDAAVWPHNVLC